MSVTAGIERLFSGQASALLTGDDVIALFNDHQPPIVG